MFRHFVRESYLRLTPRLRKSGAILPLHLTSSWRAEG